MAKNGFDELMSIGIDIGKDTFHLVGFDLAGQRVLRKQIKRLALIATFEKLPRCVVGMEACLSAHFVSRTLRKMGFEPRIIPAIYVKPFNKGQKNDYNDAEAIAEAALRPNLKVVSEKTQDQLDLQALHRVRSRLVSRRTATINQIRAFLIEQGITVRKGVVLFQHYLELDRRVKRAASQDEVCMRMMTVPGVGPIAALTFKAAVDDPSRFRRSRTVAAYFGLTPRRFQSGEHDNPGRIPKAGDRDVRATLYAAANVLLMRTMAGSQIKSWGMRLMLTKGRRRAVVAVARKLAVLLHRMWIDGSEFRQEQVGGTA